AGRRLLQRLPEEGGRGGGARRRPRQRGAGLHEGDPRSALPGGGRPARRVHRRARPGAGPDRPRGRGGGLMAGTMPTGGGRTRTLAAINVTPLVDVVLVLLVILMVASTYIVAQTLKVQLPRAHSTDGTAEKPTKVEIMKDGKLRWNEEPIAENVLE